MKFKGFKNREDRVDIYTDLALEEREKFKDNVEIDGVELKKKYNDELKMTTTLVNIKTEKGAKVMGKPKGHYITIETKYAKEDDKYNQKKISDELLKNIGHLINANIGKDKRPEAILIVGLGNAQATPDAIGPRTASLVQIRKNIYCISPGVLAQTGMETFSIVKGIVDEMKPDLIIAIDSLAARNISRVTTTIQLTDTGIIPGSGIGNNREGLNRENLGCTVIAIGVPMVVHSVTIVNDTMDKLIYLLSQNMENNCLQKVFEDFTVEEKYQLFAEIMTEDIGQMFVTPKDVDEIVDNLSTIIENSINRL